MARKRHSNGNGTYMPKTVRDLPEAAQNAIIAFREHGEAAWRGLADTSAALWQSGGWSKGDAQESVGNLAGCSGRTIRHYCDWTRDLGALRDEFDMYTLEHWKAMKAQLKLACHESGTHPATRDEWREGMAALAAEWLKTAEKFGGMIVPPAVIWAAVKIDPTPEEQWESALRSLASAHDRAVRATNAGVRPGANVLALLDTAGDAIAALVEAADADAVPAALRPERDEVGE